MVVDTTQSNPPEAANYEQLKKAANRMGSWRDRLQAVEALGKFHTSQVVDVLLHRMNNDPVYRVREAAFRQLKQFGEDVQTPARPKGDLVKDFRKVVVRVKKSLPAGHSYEQFKEKLQKMRVDVYDAYEGDKGEEFDTWLASVWASLGQK